MNPAERPATGPENTGGTTRGGARRRASAAAPAEPATTTGAGTRALDVAVVTALLILAWIPLTTVFTGWPVFVTAAAGLIAGWAVVACSARWRWSIAVTAAATAAVYLLIAPAAIGHPGAIGGVLPGPGALTDAGLWTTAGWKRLLTINPPAVDEPDLLVPVLVITYLSTVVAGLIALRSTRPVLAALPVAATLIVAIVFGTSDTRFPAVTGAAIVLLTVVWSALRPAPAGGRGGRVAGPTRAGRIAAGTATVALAGVVAAFAAPAAIVDEDRTLLRNHVTPPLDTRELISPLIGYRNFQKDLRDASLVTVSGLPADARLRLATLDVYDGTIYTVAPDRTGDTGVFERPAQARHRGGRWADLPVGEQASVQVTVGDLTGTWLPGLARGAEVDPAGGRADELRSGLFVNPASGTVIATGGIEPGDRYTVAGTIARQVPDTAIGAAPVAALAMPASAAGPPIAAELAAEWIAEAQTPLEQARAIEQQLHREGFYSNGLDGQVASRAGHTTERIAALLDADQMIGDEEQYAVAMAVMAQSVGLPARVVVGFIPPETYDGVQDLSVTGRMASAWVEIPFHGVGWVTFDPTPDRDREPQQLAPKPKNSPKPRSVQPPPPAHEDVDLLTALSPGDDASDPNTWAWLWGLLIDWAILLGKALALLALVLIGPAAVWLAKRRRTAARSGLADPREKVAAGWDELIDVLVDLGYGRRPGGTRREAAAVLAQRYPHLAVTPLAVGADAGAFAPGDLAAEQADAYWVEVAAARAELRAGQRPLHWWWSRINPRSLIGAALAERTDRLVAAVTGRFRALRDRLRPPREREWTR